MHKKFKINQTKIKGGCQSGRKVITHDSKSDLPLETMIVVFLNKMWEVWKGVRSAPSFLMSCQESG